MTMTLEKNRTQLKDYALRVYQEPVLKTYMDMYLSTTPVRWFMLFFPHNGMVYRYIVHANDMDLKLWRVEAFYKENSSHPLRFFPLEEQREQLVQSGLAVEWREESEVKEFAKKERLNLGYAVEKLVHMEDNQKWKRGNDAYYTGGDIVIDGIDYQVKYMNASLTRESTLTNKYNEVYGTDIKVRWEMI